MCVCIFFSRFHCIWCLRRPSIFFHGMQGLHEGRGKLFTVNMKHLDIAFPLKITMQYNLCDSGQIDDSPHRLFE